MTSNTSARLNPIAWLFDTPITTGSQTIPRSIESHKLLTMAKVRGIKGQRILGDSCSKQHKPIKAIKHSIPAMLAILTGPCIPQISAVFLVFRKSISPRFHISRGEAISPSCLDRRSTIRNGNQNNKQGKFFFRLAICISMFHHFGCSIG